MSGVGNATTQIANDITCNPAVGILTSCSLEDRLLDTKYVTDSMFKWQHAVYIVLILVFLLLARFVYQIKLWLLRDTAGDTATNAQGEKPDNNPNTFNGQFAYQLTDKDNKAVSVSFAAYMFSVGLILWASMSELPDDQPAKNIGLICQWQVLGVILLEIARVINDKFLFTASRLGADRVQGFNNTKELLRENVAVGAVESGSYISAAMVIMAAISGAPGVWWQDLVSSLIWFVLGQLAFVIFALIINTPLITSFNFFVEVKRRNVAAGVLFALEVIAIANLIANSILKSDSFVTFGVWYVLGGVLLIGARFLVDYAIIPSRTLNAEIKEDQNLGAAILVGGIPLGLSFVVNTFLPDTCLNPT